LLGSWTEAQIDEVVRAEVKLLKDAAQQVYRPVPYRLVLRNGTTPLGEAKIINSQIRDDIIADRQIDGPTWQFTGAAEFPLSARELIMVLESRAEDLVEVLRVS
jgi:hypothetical protein